MKRFRLVILVLFSTSFMSFAADEVVFSEHVDALGRLVQAVQSKSSVSLRRYSYEETIAFRHAAIEKHDLPLDLVQEFSSVVESSVFLYDKKIKEVSEKVKLVGIGFSFRQLHSEIALVNGAFIRLIKAFCNSLQHREKLCESSLLDEETSELKRKLLKLELSKWAKKACKKDPSLGDEGFIGTFMKKVERGIDEILELDLEENREFFEKRGSSFEEKWIHIQRIRFFKDYREKLEELLEERLQYLPVLIYSPSKSRSEKTAHQRCHEASYYYFGN